MLAVGCLTPGISYGSSICQPSDPSISPDGPLGVCKSAENKSLAHILGWSGSITSLAIGVAIPT